MSSPVITKVIEHESTFNGQLPLPVNVPKVLIPSLGLAFTISLWVTAKSISGATCLVSLGRNPQNYFNEMMLQIKGNKISYFEYATGPNSFEVLTPDVVVSGVLPLTHIVVVRDGRQATIYLNGNVSATTVSPLSAPVTFGNFDFTVGWDPRDQNSFLNGTIENFSIYPNSALRAVDVSMLYQLNAHEAKAMLLSCMDFRLLDDITRFMDSRGYTNNYDQFILAGASLGSNQTTFPEWNMSWERHLSLAEKLHKVSEVICVDHDKCGAYKEIYGKKFTFEEERALHVTNLRQFRDRTKAAFPNLKKISLYVMKLDGGMDEIV